MVEDNYSGVVLGYIDQSQQRFGISVERYQHTGIETNVIRFGYSHRLGCGYDAVYFLWTL